MLTFGIFLGLVAILGTAYAVEVRQLRWMRNWLSPWGKKGVSGLNRRILQAFSPSPLLELAPLLVPLANPVGLLLLAPDPGSQIAVGYYLGYLGTVVVCYPIFLRRLTRKWRGKFAYFAAQKLILKNPESEIIRPGLRSAAVNGNPFVRIAAAVGARNLGSIEDLHFIQTLFSDPNPKVAEAARQAYCDWMGVYQDHRQFLVRDLEKQFKAHDKMIWRNQVEHSSSAYYENQLQEMENTIDEYLFWHFPYRRGYPDIFCQQCRTRAEELFYLGRQYVRCRHCHEVKHLVTGVKSVIGQIGGDAEWEVQERLLYTNVWNNVKHIAIPTEIDELHISGGKDMNYDWAVNAVLDMLQKHQGDQGKTVKVSFQHAVRLEPNTWVLLRKLDDTIKVPTNAR